MVGRGRYRRRSWTLGVAVVCSAVAALGPATEADEAGADEPVGELSRPSSATATAVRPIHPPRTFSIVATGDVLVEAGVRLSAAATGTRTGRRFDFGDILGRVAPVLRAADLAICHLEIPVGRPGEASGSFGRTPYGGNRLLSPYEIVPDLASAGIDRCSTASNHSWDLGAEGVATTLLALDEQGIRATGTARTPEEAAARAEPFDVAGVRVAHVSYTTRSNAGLPDLPWRVDMATSTRPVVDAVRAARAAGAEVVIVSLHTFRERDPAPTPLDRDFTTRLVSEADIDLVVQHGPHVVQPLELVGGTWVFWSVGNLVSAMGEPGDPRYGPSALDGLLAWVRFTESTSTPGRFEVDPIPVVVCAEIGSRHVYPGVTALADPAGPPIGSGLRTQLEACVARTRSLVPSAI